MKWLILLLRFLLLIPLVPILGLKTLGEPRPKPSGLMAITDVGLQPITMHPFATGNLTPTGDQYSTPATSGTAENTYATVALATANPPLHGDLVELELGVVAALRSEGTAGDISWKWQARNVRGGAVFQDLMAEDSTVSPGITFFDSTATGRPALQDHLDKLPLEVQLLVKSTKISDGVAKAKNSTYVYAVTSALYKRKLD